MLIDPPFSLCRFDFDFSLEESIQRRLDLSVKNSVSFMSRERELIGKVYMLSVVPAMQLIVVTVVKQGNGEHKGLRPNTDTRRHS